MHKTQDARKVKAAALHLLRRRVVQAVRAGKTQTGAARTYGACLRVVSNWVRLDWTADRLSLSSTRDGGSVGDT